MTSLIDQIRADREAGTPGEWFSEGETGPRSQWDGATPATIGVWSQHRLDAAIEAEESNPDCVADPDDEKWILGVWGKAGAEDQVNARRIARVPDLEAAYLASVSRIERLEAALSDCVTMLEALRDESGRGVEYDEEDAFRMGEWFAPDELVAIADARAALAKEPTDE